MLWRPGWYRRRSLAGQRYARSLVAGLSVLVTTPALAFIASGGLLGALSLRVFVVVHVASLSLALLGANLVDTIEARCPRCFSLRRRTGCYTHGCHCMFGMPDDDDEPRGQLVEVPRDVAAELHVARMVGWTRGRQRPGGAG